MHIEVFYWRTGGQVVHRGVRVDGDVELTAEGCNYDDAEPVLSRHWADLTTPDTRDCKRCLPEEQIYGVAS